MTKKDLQEIISKNSPKKGKEISKEVETTEQTTSGDAGSFEGPAFSDVIKRPISKIHNSTIKEEEEVDEATDASSSGSFDVPLFGKTTKGGRKDPLKIDGPSSIGQSRAVKDKKFPKWGGPKGVYIKVKEKCKKFPYCNQGDINSIELLEIEGLKETILETSEKYGVPYKEIEKIVLNDIKEIFIEI